MSEVMLRPMGVGDILDATFRLYRANFVTFALIGLVAYVPYALVVAPSGSDRGEPSGRVIVISALITASEATRHASR